MTRERAQRADHDQGRYKKQPWRAWYSTKAWRLRRAQQLDRVPWCEPCKVMGKSRKATVANHNPPHLGDRIAFFHGPLESTCKECHDGMVQAAEGRGFRCDVDAEGWPSDKNHIFNRRNPR